MVVITFMVFITFMGDTDPHQVKDVADMCLLNVCNQLILTRYSSWPSLRSVKGHLNEGCPILSTRYESKLRLTTRTSGQVNCRLEKRTCRVEKCISLRTLRNYPSCC